MNLHVILLYLRSHRFAPLTALALLTLAVQALARDLSLFLPFAPENQSIPFRHICPAFIVLILMNTLNSHNAGAESVAAGNYSRFQTRIILALLACALVPVALIEYALAGDTVAGFIYIYLLSCSFALIVSPFPRSSFLIPCAVLLPFFLFIDPTSYTWNLYDLSPRLSHCTVCSLLLAAGIASFCMREQISLRMTRRRTRLRQSLRKNKTK